MWSQFLCDDYPACYGYYRSYFLYHKNEDIDFSVLTETLPLLREADRRSIADIISNFSKSCDTSARKLVNI